MLNLMRAIAFICDKTQNFSIKDLVLTNHLAHKMEIRALYAGENTGTEVALMCNELSQGPYLLCTEHMGTGGVATDDANINYFKVRKKVCARGNDRISPTNSPLIRSGSGAHGIRMVTRTGATHR